MLKPSFPTTYHTAGTPYSPAEDRCYTSGPEVIRRRGGNPIETLEQQARRVRQKAASGIPAAPSTLPAVEPPADPE